MFHDGIRAADRTHRPRPPRLPQGRGGRQHELGYQVYILGNITEAYLPLVVTVVSDSTDGALRCSSYPLMREMRAFATTESC